MTMIAGAESKARALGAEEIYIAAAPDLGRGTRFHRIEGEAALGKTFALRATVAYKGTWIRLVRSVCDTAIAQEAQRALRKPSHCCRAIAALPASVPGWSKAAAWRSRSIR